MIVVETFSDSSQDNEGILSRIDGHVVGFAAPHMGSAVDQPCLVQSEAESEQSRDEVSVEKSFIPKIHWDGSRQDETAD